MVINIRNEKEKDRMIHQKAARLQKMKFKNHKEFLKELVAAEFDSMGISYADTINNHEEMQEWIRKKKARLLEIEAQNKKKDKEPLIERLEVIRTRTSEEQEFSYGESSSSSKRKAMDKMVFEPPVAHEQTMFEKILSAISEPEIETENVDDKKRKASSSLVLEGKKKKKAMKEEINPPVAPEPASAPAIPGELMNAITWLGGEDVMWVIEKPLEKTDVSKGHNRLSIPGSQVKLEDHLTKAERIQLSKKTAIAVDVLLLVNGDHEPHQPQLWSMNFNKWQMNSTGIYVLLTKWRTLVEENHLQKDDKVQVWSFKTSQNGGEKKLSFAINVLRGAK